MYNNQGLADFGEYREAIDTMVKLLEVEVGDALADAEMAFVYKEELWAMRNNFSEQQWHDATRVAAKRFRRDSYSDSQSA